MKLKFNSFDVELYISFKNQLNFKRILCTIITTLIYYFIIFYFIYKNSLNTKLAYIIDKIKENTNQNVPTKKFLKLK